MKIGIDARFFGPGSKGLGRYTQKLIAHLEDMDQDNEYVIFLRADNFDEYVSKNKNFKKIIADYKWYSFSEQLLFPFLLYKYKLDLVHFPHFNVPILYFKKFIVTIHDLILLKYPTKKATTRNKLFYKIKFFVYRLVIFNAINKAVQIITVSRTTKDDICAQYGDSCAKTNVIYESAEIQSIRSSNNRIIFEKYGIIKPYILYVGNAYPHKNLNKLVEAFKIFDQTKHQLVLVGNNDYFYERLAKYIKDEEIKNIIILYTITDKDLCAIYSKAAAFVFPSLYEGFGLPPLEAQLYKIPVLSGNHGCMKEILSIDGALYCNTRNEQEFAQKMKQITENVTLRKNLIEKGYLNAKKYSWKQTAKETYDIYKKVI